MSIVLTEPRAQTSFKWVEGGGRFISYAAWPVGLNKCAAGIEEACRQARDGAYTDVKTS